MNQKQEKNVKFGEERSVNLAKVVNGMACKVIIIVELISAVKEKPGLCCDHRKAL